MHQWLDYRAKIGEHSTAMKKILIVGGGGREHAIAWKLASDSSKPDLYCMPGNAGTSAIATNLAIGAEDIDAIVKWAAKNRPDLVVVGPEVPLCEGVADKLQAIGIAVFGPNKDAAVMEGSKIFAKEIMEAAGVPTAASAQVSSADEARAALNEFGVPVVIKADGLAAGKGVYICTNRDEAEASISEIFDHNRFGSAGSTALIEEFLQGEEASILALIDGEHIVMLASSQDHKRAYNNDQGPNTGGMGAYSPAPVVTDELWPVIREQVFERTLSELKKRGITYKGVLYGGLMITKYGPKVLEFNCRFGDPECQVVLPRIDGDLLPVLMAVVNGTLDDSMIKWKEEHCACVVMASGGYPGSYEKGITIEGLEDAGELDNTVVFHAGTLEEDGVIKTSGGRVLAVTSLGDDLAAAVKQAYQGILKIKFDEAHYRTDIASKAL